MARPTLAAQLSKAAADGDMEKVKELALKLEKSQTKTKPKTKAKPKTKKQAKVEVYEEEIYVPEDPYDVDDNENQPTITTQTIDTRDFIVNAKRSDHQESYIDEDGEEKVRAKKVPFKIIKNRKNKWVDDVTLETADIEFDKAAHKHGVSRGQKRPPTTKVKAQCSRCNQVKLVWPGEVTHRNWACDQCLVSNKHR